MHSNHSKISTAFSDYYATCIRSKRLNTTHRILERTIYFVAETTKIPELLN
jgi:hypothetical protein